MPALATTASTPQRAPSASWRARAATCACMSATSRCETSPAPASTAIAWSGWSVWTWIFSVRASPTTSTESPSASSASREASRLEPAAGDREVRAVAVGRGEVLRVGDARRRVVLERRRLVAAQRGDDAGEDHDQRVAAGVDDAGLAQHREQIGRAHHRGLARRDGALEHAGDRVVLVLGADVGAKPRVGHVRKLDHHAVGHLAHDREDRALGGLAHRGVGAVGSARERGADQRRVDQLAGTAERAPRPRRGSAARGSRRCCRALRAAPPARPTRRSRRGRSRRSCAHRPRRGGRAPPAPPRIVSTMLSPVSPSATGNTLRSLTSWRRDSRCGERPGDQGAEADQVRVRHDPPRLSRLGDLAGLEAARADVDPPRRAGRSTIRTFCRFGLKRRRVATIEWLRLLPNAGPFAHEWQILAIWTASLAARERGADSGERRELARAALRSAVATVAAGARQRLLVVVDGQHTEAARDAGVE